MLILNYLIIIIIIIIEYVKLTRREICMSVTAKFHFLSVYVL